LGPVTIPGASGAVGLRSGRQSSRVSQHQSLALRVACLFDLLGSSRPENALGQHNPRRVARRWQTPRGQRWPWVSLRKSTLWRPNLQRALRLLSQPSRPGLLERVILILVARLAGELPAMVSCRLRVSCSIVLTHADPPGAFLRRNVSNNGQPVFRMRRIILERRPNGKGSRDERSVTSCVSNLYRDRSVSRARTGPVGERGPGGSWRGEYGSGLCARAEASFRTESCELQRLSATLH
jgi:hypothetical protein